MTTQIVAQRAYTGQLKHSVIARDGEIAKGSRVTLVWFRSYLTLHTLFLRHDYFASGYDRQGRYITGFVVSETSMEGIVYHAYPPEASAYKAGPPPRSI
jgi:hypothetical protein